MAENGNDGRLIAGMAAAGWLRWAAVDIAAVLESVRLRMDLSPTSAAVLGRSLAGAALLQQFSTGGADRILLEISGHGPIRTVVAEADAEGRLRGLVDDPRAETLTDSFGELAVGAAVGGGTLRVVRARDGKVHSSQVELTRGDVGEGLATYLLQSEQTRSAVLVGVLAGPEGVTAAGGLMIEAFPGAPEESVAALETRLAECESISRALAAGGLEGVVDTLLTDDREDHLDTVLCYRCRCSRERIRRYLEQLDEADRQAEDGDVTVDCGFCGERYAYSPEELASG